MCGRYVSPEEAELNREYLIDRSNSGARIRELFDELRPSFNVAPTQLVPVFRVVRDAAGVRESIVMRWGLVPFFAKGEPPKYSTINATIEKLETGPCWRGPWKRGQRCVIPCVGFYEWHVNADGSKTPYFIRPAEDGVTFAFAGLWDESVTPAGESILSCTIITMPPNDLMKFIHNAKQRMPAILLKEDIDAWISGTPEQAKAALKQYPSTRMRAHTVSRAVNTPKNNTRKLIEYAADPNGDAVPAELATSIAEH